MRNINFFKYSGAGNDFILIDNRTQFFPPTLVPTLCHRQEGIGADGILLLESSNENSFKMQIFNADGSFAEMCGNGIRCFTKFLHDLGIVRNSYRIENMEGKIFETALSCENQVSVKMAPISNMVFHRTCHVNDQNLVLHSLNTGVPHAVSFVSCIENVDVDKLGKAIRHHPDFQPKGTNANFVKLDETNILKLRTYERGVEKETLACGTGACAAAITAAKLFNLSSPIHVQVRSKALLTINFKRTKEAFFDLILEGPAKKVFEGSFFIQ